ncbi:MAG: DNA recombination protein RmuC [Gammaproteobacteria bacterium]|nr:MAG: DNA recombination protein RmuC [Gammaproteobacteria bacterium]
MAYLDLHNPLIVALIVTGAVLLLAIIFIIVKQRKAARVQQELIGANNEMATKLALEQQSHGQQQQINSELKTSLDDEQSKGHDLREALHSAEKNNQALKIEQQMDQEFNQQRLQQFEDSKKQLKIEFENLAGKILDEKAKALGQTSQSSIESLLKPFREQIEGFQKRVNDVHTESVKGNASLESEIKKVLEVGLKMGKDAHNLTSALKGDSQQRGGWGEAQLERTLEMSGLVAGTHFEKQSAFKDAHGRRKQTDYLINVPGGKQMIIDSKVSLVAYDKVVAADTPEAQALALSEHANAVKRHIDDLAGKDYTNLIGIRSPSFVLMFMPIEPAYIEALKFEKDLFSYGYEKNIVLVSHTTLIPILRTVANLWMMERSNEEAREISEKAGDIFNQVCEVAIRLQKLGGSLGAAVNHYNDTLTSLAGRQGLHGKVERFSQLSSKVSKSLPVLEPLHKDLDHEKLELIIEPLESDEPDEKEAVKNVEVEIAKNGSA